jgi:kynurenine--oxoglutarate transaminase/cysteine-S-conjugate beta-lyase/glutamine--phenylpyruvate transaminase
VPGLPLPLPLSAQFTPLSAEVGAINCGQGFPDWPSPAFVKDALRQATMEDNANQYCRSAGLPKLTQALAQRYSRFLGRQVDWATEVTIGVGASETLFAAMQALVDAGDEVLLISPAFDIYASQVLMAGGTARYVPLRIVEGAPAAPGAPPTQLWKLDMAEFAAAFTPRTRVVVLNSPHNPTGKCFDAEELAQMAEVIKRHPRVVVVSDEVYEHMVYAPRQHLRIATLPGMWERTLTVSSAGKTFSVTGWKIGWAVGPEALVRGLVLTNQWVQYSVSTPAQHAVALCLERADQPYEGFANYYAWLNAEYVRKRDTLTAGLVAAGLRPIAPEGGFFIIADTSNVAVPESYMSVSTKACPVMTRDWAFCRFLTLEHKVACIPPSAFFEGADKAIAKNIARFAFCKEDASLEEACRRLAGLRGAAVDPKLLPPL